MHMQCSLALQCSGVILPLVLGLMHVSSYYGIHEPLPLPVSEFGTSEAPV